ncbi:hypothetical protein LJR143_000945 [Pseudoxanthomonas sp. LjRoot143]|uniref:hypothetical protein n=1 Tax=Pseudoxanthomonas sp. LjRoot143 TaxID=3342266 RepID=UPI003ECFCD07
MKTSMWMVACMAAVGFPVHAADAGLPPGPLAPALQIEIVLAQQELDYEIPATGQAVSAGVGGLLGMWIGNSIDKSNVEKGESRIGAIRDLLVDYPANARLEAELRAKLPVAGLSPAPRITVCTTPGGVIPMLPVGCSAEPADGVLVITPTLSMDSKFENLTVRLDAQRINRTLRSNGKPKVKLVDAFLYKYRFPIEHAPDNEPEQNAQLWTQLGDGALPAMLDFGIVQVTDMVVYDFSSEGRAERLIPKRGSTAFGGKSFDGQQVRVGDHWVWTRMGKSYGHALHGYYPVSATARPMPASTPVQADAATAAPAESGGEQAPEPASAPAADTAGGTP